jgi:DNA-binding response OmpR family regulator
MWNRSQCDRLTRVLIVDDDRDNLDMFSEVLLREGFEVDRYVDPLDALTNFKPGAYDLVILDYLLPGTNGLQVYDQIRTVDKTVHIIILTGSSALRHMIKEGLTVIEKPIFPSRLIEAIAMILNPTLA